MANNDNVVPTQHQGDTTKMSLHNDITVNGIKYRAGQNVEVPKVQADDIARMDYEAVEQKNNLVRQPKEFMGPAGINPMTGKRW